MYRQADGVVARKVVGELVLVPPGGASAGEGYGGGFVVLNETAELLWNLLSSPRSTQDMARHLIQTYGVESDRAQADVEAFVRDMCGCGAVQGSEEK